jgi:hypothetical protein
MSDVAEVCDLTLFLGEREALSGIAPKPANSKRGSPTEP